MNQVVCLDKHETVIDKIDLESYQASERNFITFSSCFNLITKELGIKRLKSDRDIRLKTDEILKAIKRLKEAHNDTH